MTLPPELEPARSIVMDVLGRRLSGDAHANDLLDVSERVVEQLLHAGWLQVPTSSAVLTNEPSPDMDSGGAG